MVLEEMNILSLHLFSLPEVAGKDIVVPVDTEKADYMVKDLQAKALR
jgi:hypothetical protein